MANAPKALLIDLSGTIHIDDTGIPGAIHAIQRLKDAKFPHLFVTNTSKESQNRVSKRLDQIGFNIETKQIFSSLSAARHLIDERKLKPLLILEDAALEDFSDLCFAPQNVDSIVVGLAPSKFNHEHLSAAFRIIKERKAPLIAINKARYFASKDGLKLGAGKSLRHC